MPKSRDDDSDRAQKLRAISQLTADLAHDLTALSIWASNSTDAIRSPDEGARLLARLRERISALRRMAEESAADDITDVIAALITTALAEQERQSSAPDERRGALVLVSSNEEIRREFELKFAKDYEITTERTSAAAVRRLRVGLPYVAVIVDLNVPGAVSIATAALSAGYAVACFPEDDLPSDLRGRVTPWSVPLRIDQIRESLHGSGVRLRARLH